MATVTAQLLIGSSHPNHGGIIPSHVIVLTENSRPALTLYSFESHRAICTWIPTLENMLEDALLMSSVRASQHKPILRIAPEVLTKGKRVELYQDLTSEQLFQLYQSNKSFVHHYKIVLTVLEGSHLMPQLDVMRHYNMDLDVCTSIYSKWYSTWTKQTCEKGSLNIEEEQHERS